MMKFIYRFGLSLVLMAAASSCVKEDRESRGQGYGPDKDGVDLVVTVDMEDFGSGLDVDYGTKAASDGLTKEQNAAIENITSLFLMVVRNDTRRMVAYRVISSCDEAVAGSEKDEKADKVQWFATKDPTWNAASGTGTEKYYKNSHWREYFETGAAAPQFPEGWGNWPERFNKLYIEKTKDDPDLSRRFSGTNDDSYNNDIYYKDDEHYGCWTDNTYSATTSDCVGYNGFAKMNDNNELINKGVYDYTQFDHDGLYDYDYSNAAYPFMDYQAGYVMRKSPAVVLTFKYANPMHGPVEQLTRGDYTIYAIANFRESISSVKGVGDDGKFQATHEIVPYVGDFVYMLMMEWDPNEGLPYETYAPLVTGAVNLSEIDIKDGSDGDLIKLNDASAILDTPEKLKEATSMVRSSNARIVCSDCSGITLISGTNNILHLMLERTVSRSTYRVTNFSSESLTVSNLKFCEHYAQAADVIFASTHTTAERFRPGWQAAPDPMSPKAIVPFDGTDGNQDGKVTIPPGATVTIFDGLMYGGGGRYDTPDGKQATGSSLVPLGYTLEASYPGVASKKLEKYTPAYTTHETEISQKDFNYLVDGLAVGGSKTTGPIGIKGRDGFLYYNAATASKTKTNSAIKIEEAFNLIDDAQYENYKWMLEIRRDADSGGKKVYKCKIKNVGADAYLRIPDGGNVSSAQNYLSFVTDAGNASEFYLSPESSGAQFSFNSDNHTNNPGTYIHALNSGNDYNVCWANWGYDDPGSWFYPFEMVSRVTTNVPEKHDPYPIEVFNADAGVTTPLYYIYRNDHLIVDINVSYNSKTNSIDFDVEPWKQYYSEITFD